MIVASLLLVIAAAVTLLIGLLNRETLEWVYASIACCLLAGLLLTIGVLRSRPSRKPVLQSGGDGQAASWAGAASQWGAGSGSSAGTDVLTRDEEDSERASGAEPVGDDDPTQTSLGTAPEAADDDERWAPSSEDEAGVRVVPPPGAPSDGDTGEIGEEAPAAAETAQDTEATGPADDDVVVVPKPSARTDAPGSDEAASRLRTADAEAAAAAPLATRGDAAKRTGDDAARFEQVLSPIAGVGPAKRAVLLQHFGTYRKLRAASPEKLAEVPGISRTLADRIHNALHK